MELDEMNSDSEFKEYPYQGRDLLDSPENYFYADCTDKNYLSAYFSYRDSIIKDLESFGNLEPSSGLDYRQDKTELNYFFKNLQTYIQNNNLEVFDKFCAKYEVRKKFWARYDQNHSPLREFGDADPMSYLNFAACLCMAYEKTQCLGYLSTLIKCCDTLCSISFDYFDSKELLYVLRKEVEYVRNIR